MVWNRTIFVFRSSFEQLSPAQRAAGAKTRVEALPEFGPWAIETKPATVGSVSGILISVNQRPMFGVLPGDLDAEAGETLEQAASQAVERLRTVLEARESQQNVPLMLRAAGFAAAATFLFVGAVWLTLRLQRKLSHQLGRIVYKSARLKIAGVDVRPHVVTFERAIIRSLTLLAVVLSDLCLADVPADAVSLHAALGRPAGHFPGRPFPDGGSRRLSSALPDLFTVAVILVLTRIVARIVSSFFRGVEQGRSHHPRVPSGDGARHPPVVRFCHLDLFPDCCLPLYSGFQHRGV